MRASHIYVMARAPGIWGSERSNEATRIRILWRKARHAHLIKRSLEDMGELGLLVVTRSETRPSFCLRIEKTTSTYRTQLMVCRFWEVGGKPLSLEQACVRTAPSNSTWLV
jgi:hypothetical protein